MMMKNYKVIIDGQINIKAENKEQAEQIISKSFGEHANKLEFFGFPIEDDFVNDEELLANKDQR